MLRSKSDLQPCSALGRSRQGAVVPLVCIMLPVLIILAAFSINFAHMELIRTQAQIASDAAVRAAGRTFSLTGSLADARTAARSIAAQNLVGGRVMSLPDSSFVLGTSTRATSAQRFAFQPLPTGSTARANAMRISVNQQDLQPLFSGITGMESYGYSRTAVSTQVEVDIVLVLDRSGSMAYAADERVTGFFFPQAAPPGWNFGMAVPPRSRWLDLVSASDAFLRILEGSFVAEQVGLVTYGDSSTLDRALSPTYTTIRDGIGRYTRNYPAGATNIAAGIATGNTVLSRGRNFASKVMVLMTDGIRTAGGDPVPTATTLGNQGIIIYTVTFSNEADQTAMRRVATAGNGQHFHASTGVSLQSAFENIARSIPTIITE